jgi:hypothetical protein
MMQNDPRGAIALSQTLAPGVAKDNALIGMSSIVIRSDPNQAIQLVNGVGNEATRVSVLQNLAANWLRQDHAAAAQWVNNSALPQNIKETLLNQTPSPKPAK